MTPLDAPRVSVVIPVYNGAAHLREAIESCLRQTEGNLEVIVVNDASPDDSAAIAKAIAIEDGRVRVLEHERNQGVAAAYNTGFHASRGRFLTRLSQDDYWNDDALGTMADFLERHTDTGLTYGDQTFVDKQGNYLSTLSTNTGAAAIYPANRVGVGVMWRRSVWESVGDFDSACDFAEDYDYWLRAGRSFRFNKCCDRPLINFRYHANQNSTTGEARQLKATQRAMYKQRLQDWKEQPLNLKALARAMNHARRMH
jgi:glycosyltransferase involved in cell wall biosynthesis